MPISGAQAQGDDNAPENRITVEPGKPGGGGGGTLTYQKYNLEILCVIRGTKYNSKKYRLNVYFTCLSKCCRGHTLLARERG